MCDEWYLELVEYPIPRSTVVNCLKTIVSKPITYENYSPLRYQTLLLESQVKYVEDIVVTRDTANLGMLRKEVIKFISDIGQANLCVQSENQLDYLICEKQLKNMQIHGWVMQYQATTTE